MFDVLCFLDVTQKGLVHRRFVLAVVVIHVPSYFSGSFWVVLVGSRRFMVWLMFIPAADAFSLSPAVALF